MISQLLILMVKLLLCTVICNKTTEQPLVTPLESTDHDLYSNVTDFSATNTSGHAEKENTVSTNGSWYNDSANEMNETDGVNDTTSAVPSSETTITPVDEPFPHDKWSPKSLEDLHSACQCDLSVTVCDVNCCCDPDCSDLDRVAFTTCKTSPSLITPDHCYASSAIVFNNAPFKSTTDDNGLFCIVFDNYQQRLYYREPKIITHLTNFEKLASQKFTYTWRAMTRANLHKLVTVPTRGPTSGSVIFILNADGELGLLALPRSLNMGTCSNENPAAYMVDETNHCQVILKNPDVDCTNLQYLKSSYYYQTFEVFKSPSGVQVYFSGENSSSIFGEKVLLKVKPVLCLTVGSHDGTCDNSTLLPPDPSFSPENATCRDVVTSVRYFLVHNGTEGIVHAEVHLWLQDVKVSHPQLTVSLHFSTQFAWVSEEPDTFRKSGNPGYIHGKPILAGKVVTWKEGEITRHAVSLDSNRQNWLTVAAPDSQGNCNLRTSIAFGINLWTGCRFQIPTVNMTCLDLRDMVMNHLLGSDPQDSVGCYGNSDINNLGEWAPILTVKESQSRGVASEISDACSEILSDLSIQIEVARIGSLANPQPKIVGITFRYAFESSVDLTSMTNSTVHITTSVSFIDVSEPAVAMFAEPPAIDIHLPHDLFYPFFTGSALSTLLQVSALQVVFYVLTTLLLVYFN